jgi:acetyl-CoA carboxylase biotin carboxyl carrier protein
MDMKDIKTLFELADKYQVAEVEFDSEEVTLRITRSHPVEGGMMMQPQMMSMPMAQAPQATPTAAVSAPVAEAVPAGNEVKSPMVGSFYAAPAPGAKNFVTQGQAVKAGDTLCIIEAMKIMNPIKSEFSGTVAKILVQNGDPVEYGQPLFIIA